MVQPKDPPISIRPPTELLADVALWARDHGVTRHAAFLQLVRRGLGAPAAPKAAAKITEKLNEAEVATAPKRAAAKPAFKSRLKGEWKAP